MQKTVMCFVGGSIWQVVCAPEAVTYEAEKWASNSAVEEVWIVPATGIRRLIRAFRGNPSFLKRAIRNMEGSYRA